MRLSGKDAGSGLRASVLLCSSFLSNPQSIGLRFAAIHSFFQNKFSYVSINALIFHRFTQFLDQIGWQSATNSKASNKPYNAGKCSEMRREATKWEGQENAEKCIGMQKNAKKC